jgi:hypothetical protein
MEASEGGLPGAAGVESDAAGYGGERGDYGFVETGGGAETVDEYCGGGRC